MKHQINEKLWTSSFIKICLVNFFIFVNFHSLLPTFPYFIEYLGGDSVAIGLATALFCVASIVSRPFLGWFIDTKGRCTMLVIGLIGMSVLPLGYFAAEGVAFAVLMRTVHGAFHASSSNAASTWVADIIPQSRMGEGLGMYGLSMAISTAVAPALGLSMMNIEGGKPTATGFHVLFIAATVAALLSLFIGISIRNRNYKCSTEPIRLSQLFERKSIPASITQFFFMVTYGVVEVYVAIYATKNSLPSGGLYFIFIAIATVLTRILLGRVIDRYGEGILVYTGNGAIIVGVLLLVFAHSPVWFIVSAIMLGYSFGAVQPSLQTMAMHSVTPERRGAASSTFFCAFDLGIAIGGFLAGVLVKYFGYDCMFVCINISSVLSLLYYIIFGRNHESSLNPRNKTIYAVETAVPASESIADMAKLPLIITISRQYGSGGHEIGELLAKRLGVPFYDSQLIEMTARESHFSEDYVRNNEQKLQNNLLFDLYQDVAGVTQGDDPAQLAIFYAQCRVICNIASNGPCVIVGRLANFILKDKARCLNVFIHADKPHRMERIISEYDIPKEKAEQELLRVDKERADHCRHFTGKEWGDSRYYHISIDSSFLGIEATANKLYEFSL
jgi:MFS family permease/cytidylate kinase